MTKAWLTLLLFVLPLCAMAQDGIHRCISADGHPLFTDQPCAALQATPVNTPPPVARPAVSQGMPLDAPAMAAPPAVTCATSVSELRQGMTDAFAARDANRLAGLMIWNGYGREAVVADIRSLSALMQRPLIDIGTGSDSDDSPSVDGDASASSLGDAASRPTSTGTDAQLIVHTASGDGSGTPHEARFNIVRRSGCLWLRASG